MKGERDHCLLKKGRITPVVHRTHQSDIVIIEMTMLTAIKCTEVKPTETETVIETGTIEAGKIIKEKHMNQNSTDIMREMNTTETIGIEMKVRIIEEVMELDKSTEVTLEEAWIMAGTIMILKYTLIDKETGTMIEEIEMVIEKEGDMKEQEEVERESELWLEWDLLKGELNDTEILK